VRPVPQIVWQFLVCAWLASCSVAPPPPAKADLGGPAATPEPTALAAAAVAAEPQNQQRGRSALPTHWRPGDVAVHGYVGAAFYEIGTDGNQPLQDEDATFPTIGGGAQYKLAGEQVDFGIEGLLGFSWNSGTTGFISTGGGAVVAVEVETLAFDVCGGPFVSVMLGDRTRLFAAAGPLLRWAIYDQDSFTIGAADDGDGFGAGWYARTGIEFVIDGRTLCGFAVRWSEASMDLDGNLGDLDVSGIDAVITVTQSF
jgi:hypothetical protein